MAEGAPPFTGGFLNIRKEPGWTSTDVVRRVKRLTGVKKVGHGGTLDPIGGGVLPVCLGAATRFAESILLGTKAYTVTVRLGAATDTFDSTGSIVREVDARAVTEDRVQAVLPQFTGNISQAPPAYSALKRDGKRLYDLARAGVEVKTEPREVVVHSLALARWAWPELDLAIECGHGFYARSLANDIGVALGSAAHMSALLRTRTGRFDLKDSATLTELEARSKAADWQALLFPLDWTLQHLRAVVLDPLREEAVQNGRPLPLGEFGERPGDFVPGEQLRAYSREGLLVAVLVYEPARQGWRPDRVLPTA